jgi:hypothetical protein
MLLINSFSEENMGPQLLAKRNLDSWISYLVNPVNRMYETTSLCFQVPKRQDHLPNPK